MKNILHILLFNVCLLVLIDSNQAQNKEFASAKIDGGDQKFEMSVSPNPFEDQLHIKINPGGKKLTGIRICDLIGTEITYIDLSNGVYSYTVDFNNLKPGIYFCTVYSDKGVVETKKIFRTK
jgi:hypothetical protein